MISSLKIKEHKACDWSENLLPAQYMHAVYVRLLQRTQYNNYTIKGNFRSTLGLKSPNNTIFLKQ